MKRASKTSEMREEYDFSSMKGGVRGKYVKKFRQEASLVLLDPEVARAFPDDAAVNRALRAVMSMTSLVRRTGSRPKPK